MPNSLAIVIATREFFTLYKPGTFNLILPKSSPLCLTVNVLENLLCVISTAFISACGVVPYVIIFLFISGIISNSAGSSRQRTTKP